MCVYELYDMYWTYLLRERERAVGRWPRKILAAKPLKTWAAAGNWIVCRICFHVYWHQWLVCVCTLDIKLYSWNYYIVTWVICNRSNGSHKCSMKEGYVTVLGRHSVRIRMPVLHIMLALTAPQIVWVLKGTSGWNPDKYRTHTYMKSVVFFGVST